MFGFPGMIISIDFGFGKVSPLTAGLITMMLVYLIGYTTAKIIGEAKNIIKPPNWNMKDNNNKNADM